MRGVFGGGEAGEGCERVCEFWAWDVACEMDGLGGEIGCGGVFFGWGVKDCVFSRKHVLFYSFPITHYHENLVAKTVDAKLAY